MDLDKLLDDLLDAAEDLGAAKAAALNMNCFGARKELLEPSARYERAHAAYKAALDQALKNTTKSC